MAQIKFVQPSRNLSMMQLSMLIIGLNFEAKNRGMLMTSPSKVNSAHVAKDFLGIDRKCKVDKAKLAEWLQLVKDKAKENPTQEFDVVTLITGTFA
jgi:hypothetical protein